MAKRTSIVHSVKSRIRNATTASSDLFWNVAGKFSRPGDAPEIKEVGADSSTAVDDYWSKHTVNSKPFRTALESEKYLEWRATAYPLFMEFMGLYGEHDGEVILDYGCGPGNDLVGFALYTRASKIIGIDISEKALGLSSHRLALHNIPPSRIELIHSSDSVTSIPLEDDSVDYVHCAGVLQHTSNPESYVEEFYRVLKPGARGCVMVYNRDSLWLHLYTAYQRIIIENAFPGMTAYEAFGQNVDGVDCPLARCYSAEEFISLCKRIGFETEYVGGYLSDTEMDALKNYREEALRDDRLNDEHKQFIESLSVDERGFPTYKGKHAGIGGVYRLYKRA
jgi:ubiquinone/menaquinone biosynthesis C-methylase UbiE